MSITTLLICWGLLGSKSPAVFVEKFIGEARSESQQLIYREIHEHEFRGGKIFKSKTDYLSPSGERMASLVADYSKSSRLPIYRFEDYRSGASEGVLSVEPQVKVWKNRGGVDKDREKDFEVDPDLIGGQGFHHFIRENLESLIDGPARSVKLLIPAKLDFFNFRIRWVETVGDLVKLRLEAESWWLRLFAPHLDVKYERSTKRLMYYYGISNIRDFEMMGNPKVRIRYEYIR